VRTLALILSGWISLVAIACGPEGNPKAHTESEIFEMDRVYKSMFGPHDTDDLTLLSTARPEILWITAINADIVGADGETPESSEYFCHSVLGNLSTHEARRTRFLGPRLGRSNKMFTLVQGLTEVRFPEGYAMPVLSSDRLVSHVMVMNPSEREQPVRVGVDSDVEYVRDSDLERPMKPLFVLPLVTKVPLEGEDADHLSHQHGGELTCLAADEHVETAAPVNRTQEIGTPVTRSKSGIKQAGHWYVPPGRHVYRHHLEPMHEVLDFDTTAHYIYAHLHPFGKSLELIDLTTGESVFKAEANNYVDQVAVERITYYSNQEGVRIHRDHDYEIVAVYDNTTDHDVDSMAVLYLYLLDSNDASPIESARSESSGATGGAPGWSEN
jgi:hypothetical protein